MKLKYNERLSTQVLFESTQRAIISLSPESFEVNRVYLGQS